MAHQPSLFPEGIPEDNSPPRTCPDCDQKMATLDRLYAKYTEACTTIADLQRQLDEAWEDTRVLREARTDVPEDAAIKQLIALAHPDRWQQGQSAATLAHEMMVALNRLREQR
jgi:hypothetical protein